MIANCDFEALAFAALARPRRWVQYWLFTAAATRGKDRHGDRRSLGTLAAPILT